MYIAISLIIISISVSLTTKTYLRIRDFIEENREMNGVYNAFNTLDYLCTKDLVFKISKSEDKLEIYERIDGEYYSIKRVFKKGRNLSLVHYNINNIEEVSNNPILENIDGFSVYKKGNLVYIILRKGGEGYIKCI